MNRTAVESRLAEVIDAEAADGTPWWPGSEMAMIAYRRLSTFARRNKSKQPTINARALDLSKGLKAHYEPQTHYTPHTEWMRLSRQLVSIYTLAEP
jgi:hypothetical protein